MRVISPEIATDFKSSFLSCEKDQELIWKKLFIENRPYSDLIKRLLVVNTPDCLDTTNVQYKDIISKYSIGRLRKEKYLRAVPRLDIEEFGDVRSYIILSFDDIVPNENPQYRDGVISFTIISHYDQWELDDYKLRPFQIAGYIDGILNNSKLTGIGKLEFMSASELPLNEHLGGVMLRYYATHSIEADKNPDMLEE